MRSLSRIWIIMMLGEITFQKKWTAASAAQWMLLRRWSWILPVISVVEMQNCANRIRFHWQRGENCWKKSIKVFCGAWACFQAKLRVCISVAEAGMRRPIILPKYPPASTWMKKMTSSSLTKSSGNLIMTRHKILQDRPSSTVETAVCKES